MVIYYVTFTIEERGNCKQKDLCMKYKSAYTLVNGTRVVAFAMHLKLADRPGWACAREYANSIHLGVIFNNPTIKSQYRKCLSSAALLVHTSTEQVHMLVNSSSYFQSPVSAKRIVVQQLGR